MSHQPTFQQFTLAKIFTKIPVMQVLIAGLVSSCLLMSNPVWAAAIKVTTIADENGENLAACSLREAVAYVNNGFKGEGGGCYDANNTSPTAAIVLQGEKTYQLTQGEITITRSLNMTVDSYTSFSNRDGHLNPVIVAAENSRVFNIDDGTNFSQPIGVIISGINLQGSGYDTNTNKVKVSVTTQSPGVSSGGLVYNRESLQLNKMRFQGGYAGVGGAIYNASADARLTVNDSEFVANTAVQNGAAIFSELPNFVINRSVFSDNTFLNQIQAGQTLYTQKVIDIVLPDDVNLKKGEPKPNKILATQAGIYNSIFVHNKAGAFNLLPQMQANNLTILANWSGVVLAANVVKASRKNYQLIAARFANSVVLNNQHNGVGEDINIKAGDLSYINHLVYANLNGSKAVSYQNKLTNVAGANYEYTAYNQLTPLFAEQTIQVDGKEQHICAAPRMGEKSGLFCPLLRLEDTFVSVVRPRLLMGYTTLSQSPIVNKGANRLDANKKALDLTCLAKDIRNQDRQICDIGAFELVINVSNNIQKRLSADIEYGEKAHLLLQDVLGDGQLIPADACSHYITSPPTDAKVWPNAEVGKWTDGCLLYVKGNAPKKGTVALNEAKDRLVYTPNYNYHGTDEFEYRLITTTTRFSDANNDSSVQVYSLINQAPPNTFQDKTLDLGVSLGSGAVTPWSAIVLLMLAGLGFYRHSSKPFK